LLTVEQGEPTNLVAKLLKELSSRIKLDDPSKPRLGPLGYAKTLSGAELIQQVVSDPQVMWKRSFYTELNLLPQD
jgi:hypothetical protein